MLAEIASNIVIESSAEYRGLPVSSDRTAWVNLPEDLRAALIAEGENYLGYAYPQILATDYMEFTRTGNRVHYEDKQFARRTALCALVLAECAEYKGRFLDDIVNGIFLICEESGWQLPAHNSADGPQMPLPDVTEPVVDLFAAETGAVLGVAEYLLRDALAKVSPAISILVNENLRKRIFLPYLTKYFWWMGNGSRPLNNWTPWCTQNILLAAFTRGADAAPLPSDWKNRVFHQACVSLDYFLADYEEDGCCDEGAQYFSHAALTLFESLEMLNAITGGRFGGVYQEPKIRNMAAYIQNVHVAGPYYLNFADCSPLAGRRGVREYLFGKRTGNDALAAFAARDYAESSVSEKLAVEEHNLFYRAQAVFRHAEMLAAANSFPEHCSERTLFAGSRNPDGTSETNLSVDLGNHQHINGTYVATPPDIFYPSAGLFIARDDHFCLAVKAGDNDDSHNHNDTGSFILYKDGRPLFIDLGVESYTQKTFSDRRYEIWTMQSAWHNLPTIGGVMQAAGPQYAAADVRYELNASETEDTDGNPSRIQQKPAVSRISMDIAPAYPDSRIRSYTRAASLEKGRRIVIRDSWSLAEPMPVVLSLLTCEKPAICSDGAAISSASADREAHCRNRRNPSPHTEEIRIGSLAACSLRGAGQISIEEIPITDPRLAGSWPGSVYRILVTADGGALELEIT